MIHEAAIAFVKAYFVENWQVSLLALGLFIGASTYTITSIAYALAARSTKDGRDPPTVPYWLPIMGSTIPFVSDIEKFVKDVQYVTLNSVSAATTCSDTYLYHRRRLGDDKPYTVKLLGQKGHLILKPEEYGPLLKATRALTNKPLMAELMENVFGTPKHVMRKSQSPIVEEPKSC